ncbi:unnamed protein product [Porites evermanni]|uniref:CIDE-N domain-containing protein n=1 Tax=Porites evermanni TaxID=104178 RepID=A0ABN8SVT7_9CNID|nr:unnamed protein product [Porites evermanni]
MPLFKVCDVSRRKRKAVVANSLEELIAKGKKKLCLEEKEECFLFEEYDGTEVDDDESLVEYEKGSSFVLGKEWIANPGTASTQSSADASPKEATKEHPAHFSEVLVESKAEEPPTSWHEVADTETGSEEDIHCSTAETIAKQEEKKTKSVDETKTEEPPTSWHEVADTETGSEEDIHCSTAETIAEQEEKKTKSVNDVLMRTPYYHAKTNNMKIYSPKEIESATGMEKKRRQFWNDKAEQLAQNQKTRNQSKTVLSGLIDVSWTLRKTSMLESDVKKLLDEEKVLFRKDDVAGKKLGTQKKDTTSKNVERMSAAHHAVEGIDQEVEEVQEAFQAVQTLVDRRKYSKEYERKKLPLDGAYTELKRAQDALTKSMKAKERDIENRLAERSGNVDVEEDDACPSSLGEI